MVGAGLRLGVEQYVASEISVQLDAGGTWFIQLDQADPLTLGCSLTSRFITSDEKGLMGLSQDQIEKQVSRFQDELFDRACS